MNPKLDALFDEPEKAYLKPEELNTLSQFISSLPERINFYRRLRNEELTLMQAVADALEQRFPQEPEERLKHSLRSGILVLRCAAMAMLLDDSNFVQRRFASWLPEIAQAYETAAIDQALYQLIKQQFAGRFTPQQMALLTPGIDVALSLLSVPDAVPDDDDTNVTSESLVGLF